MPVIPRRLDKHVTTSTVARFGDASPLTAIPRLMRAWSQAEKRHQLGWSTEPAEIANLTHQHHRRMGVNTTQATKFGNSFFVSIGKSYFLYLLVEILNSVELVL
jgi:hypothetical protein